MTVYNNVQSNKTNPFGLFLILFVVAVIGALLLSNIGEYVSMAVNEHALERHSYSAYIVDECLEEGSGYLGSFRRESDGRVLKICQIDTDVFGVRIEESNEDTVTLFIKEKLKSIQQVIRYARNTGYTTPLDEIAINLVKILQ